VDSEDTDDEDAVFMYENPAVVNHREFARYLNLENSLSSRSVPSLDTVAFLLVVAFQCVGFLFIFLNKIFKSCLPS
jgi:hypothetical protein